MNKTLSRVLLAALFGFGFSAGIHAQGQKLSLPQASPAATLKQKVGFTDIQIEYSRPGVKDRKIFGSEVAPYGEVWRTGANSATKVVFSTNVKFGGTEVPAGTYALFSIPDPNEWTVILNKGSEQWGSYSYDASKDVVRVKAKPVVLSRPVETFTIDINDIRDDSATLDLVWEKTLVPVKLEFEVVPTARKQIEAAIASTDKPSANLLFAAAGFYYDHNLDLDQAANWVASAVAQQPDAFYMSYLQARILAKKGDKAGAIAAAKKSIEGAARSKNEAVKAEYTRKNEKIISELSQ